MLTDQNSNVIKKKERRPNQREIRIENGAVGKFGVNKIKRVSSASVGK